MAERLVLIQTPVVAMIQHAAQTCGEQPEAGGILMGGLRGPHLECTSFSEPGPDDQRSHFQFTRQDPSHQKIAEASWKDSQGEVTFIGEWHTHPAGRPHPSLIDTKSWRKLTQKAAHHMLFLIAAPGAWKAFLVKPGRLRGSVHELSICEKAITGLVLT